MIICYCPLHDTVRRSRHGALKTECNCFAGLWILAKLQRLSTRLLSVDTVYDMQVPQAAGDSEGMVWR